MSLCCAERAAREARPESHAALRAAGWAPELHGPSDLDAFCSGPPEDLLASGVGPGPQRSGSVSPVPEAEVAGETSPRVRRAGSSKSPTTLCHTLQRHVF